LSHLEVLRQGVTTGKVVHVLEDDTWLGNRSHDVFTSLVSSEVIGKFDLVYTDVLLDYLTSQRYFRAFYEAARVPSGAIPPRANLVNLQGLLFTCTSSYFVHPRNIAKVLGVLEQEFRSLNLQSPEPIDMVIRRLVSSGEMTAAVTCPFLTSIDLSLMTDSSINDPAAVKLQKTLLLHGIHRQAFFYGTDDRSLVALVESLFPEKQRTEKSRVLALLHEQFLVEEQQRF
jgi:hypothetical protein